ncbi:PP2C family serine/threonine-protein phosphatase [Ascoidea rubescens DSM 1968]|uniref:PP2C-domain-containing protein n=1 Tax=Ascoidea rubescens DSM 1968 TaxID=1344418 RepID=A0A1D2VGF4_9ASCO|nr:PP2C-domain-containing protein [Ascoidea rubescens DSM 1968]ODV60744.1 PP2C-domain-containing protein [Ascoidea rubescens DSM 1968]
MSDLNTTNSASNHSLSSSLKQNDSYHDINDNNTISDINTLHPINNNNEPNIQDTLDNVTQNLSNLSTDDQTTLIQKKNYKLSFDVGVSENKNPKYRPTMEDVHTYVANFCERLDWGYFALFDGHAGKQAAKWCGQNLHLLLQNEILKNEKNSSKLINDQDIRSCLNNCFQEADNLIADSNNSIGSSGCTAAVAIISNPPQKNNTNINNNNNDNDTDIHKHSIINNNENYQVTKNNYRNKDKDMTIPQFSDQLNNSKIKRKLQSNFQSQSQSQYLKDYSNLFDFIPTPNHRRMLYTANVGDSRLVLCRNGFAIRLSYDHKGSDTNESNRIVQSGGLIMRNRVNGILAITRSLGDHYLKNLIIGKPYTTALEMTDGDEFLIIACDGLWDIIKDQDAVDLIRNEANPQVASRVLCDHAIKNLSMDNVTVMIIRFDQRILELTYSDSELSDYDESQSQDQLNLS